MNKLQQVLLIGLLAGWPGSILAADQAGGIYNGVPIFPVIISTYAAVPSAPSAGGLVPVAPPAPAMPAVPAEPVQAAIIQPAPRLVAITSASVASPIVSPAIVAYSTASIPAALAISSSSAVVQHPVSTTTVTQVPVASSAAVMPAVAAHVPPPVTPAATITAQALSPSSLMGTPTLTRPVSLDLKDMDVVEVLKMLCKQNSVNVIVDKNVSGRVTLLLNNVEFWEALGAILNSRDLAYSKEGDLVEVMAAQDYERIYGIPFSKKTQRLVVPLKHAQAKTAKDMLDGLKSKVGTLTVDEITNSLIIDDNPTNVAQMQDALAKFDLPQEMHIFRLNYATAEDLEPKINPLISKEFGSLQMDKRSNTLIVTDNPARISQISEVIKAFDVRHKCVLIEAKIMQVILSKNTQTGVNWQGINWTYILDKLNGYHLTGNLVQNLQLVPQASLAAHNVTAPGITASVGVLEKPDFQFIINMLSTVGTTNLLSSPRVMALDRQEAKIHVGSKAAKITQTILNVGSTTSNPVTTENVEFLDTGVKLSVTPIIGDDGMVTMKVKPEVSSVENTITTTDGSIIPIIRTSEAEASLIVKDGVTVVIGGLIEDSKAKTDNEVPFLGRIPLIGVFFRNRQKSDQKTELAIFLTPHIVTGDAITPEVQNKLDIKPDGTPRKKGFFRRLFGG